MTIKNDLQLVVENENDSVKQALYLLSNLNNCLTHGEWQHIAIIRDGANLRMYVNGLEVGHTTIGGTFNNISYGYYLGQHGHDNTLRYKGSIDEVTVWDRPLSVSELQDCMNINFNGEQSGLISRWNMNEGSGNIVYDVSGNGNNGQIYD